MTTPVYAIPTADAVKCGATFAKWRAMGYLTAALTDGETKCPDNCDLHIHFDNYHGYPWAVNELCRSLLEHPILVFGGDDMDPDPRVRGDEIAGDFLRRFPDTFGVMQPTGDRQGAVINGLVPSERICGSPWMGRAFVERWNGGAGPFWPGYHHMFADEEAKETTQAAGILWQRPDLTHLHHHWSWRGQKMPPYMTKAHARWDDDKALFLKRKAAAFPGHAPSNKESLHVVAV